MYSGITGQEFAADIYIGVVYYQRLRHMVLDKFQVRTTGPVDPVTRQPVKVIFYSLRLFRYSDVHDRIAGPETRGWDPIRRDGTRRAHRARDFIPVARQADELLRLLNCLGLSHLWQPNLPGLRGYQPGRSGDGSIKYASAIRPQWRILPCMSCGCRAARRARARGYGCGATRSPTTASRCPSRHLIATRP
jgi:DNA-directed RNA polymerase I subunit RPA2